MVNSSPKEQIPYIKMVKSQNVMCVVPFTIWPNNVLILMKTEWDLRMNPKSHL